MAEHGTTTKWRDGCRCDSCRSVNAAWLREVLHREQLQAIPLPMRQRILTLVRGGATPAQAAAECGTTVRKLWGIARSSPAFAADLDEALLTGRARDVPHGTASGYRNFGCRCPDCRRAH